MRITHTMLKRNYLNNLNKNMTNLMGSNERMSSQRRFNRASEDVSAANRALRVRLELTNNERYSNTIRDATGKFSAAEDNLRAISTLMQNVNERMVQAMNGTIPDSDREKIAREIENFQTEILQISNAQYNGEYMFGAAGSGDGSAPFQVVNGKISFNGTDVDSMFPGTGADEGKIMYMDNSVVPAVAKEIPFNKKNYIDIGLGFTVTGSGLNAKLDTKTAVESTISGVQAFGFGTDANGIPQNLFSLLGKVADDMRSGDNEAMGKSFEAIKRQADNLLMNITDLGNRTAFIQSTGERISNDTINLQEIQNDLEAVPIQEESIYNKDYEMSWMITLQMGAKILPASIFDFMR